MSRLIAQIRPGDLVLADRWLGKRRTPRSQLLVPVVVRIRPQSDPASSFTCELRDISASGMGVSVSCELEPYQSVLVELRVADAHWAGEMFVIHCTQGLSGYRVGLACQGCPDAELDAPVEPAEAQPETVDTTLQSIKTEIRAAVRSYRRAQAFWGLLGSSVESRIARAIETLPPVPQDRAQDARRQHPRHPVTGDVQVVIPSTYVWKLLQGRIDDISHGGAKLFLPMKDVEDLIERELIGDFSVHPQMLLVVGVETAEETLWLPSRVIHCTQRDQLAEFGVSFLTGPSIKAFQP